MLHLQTCQLMDSITAIDRQNDDDGYGIAIKQISPFSEFSITDATKVAKVQFISTSFPYILWKNINFIKVNVLWRWESL